MFVCVGGGGGGGGGEGAALQHCITAHDQTHINQVC